MCACDCCVSSVIVLSVFGSCCVSIVVCTCECFALDHNVFCVFHPLTTVEVKTRTIFEISK